MTDAVPARKRALREEVRAALAAWPVPAREVASAVIVDLLRGVLPGEGLVLGFLGLSDEPDLRPLLAELAVAGRLLLPRVLPGDRLEVHAVRDLVRDTGPGAFGVREPVTPAATGLPATVLVPGRAFDPRGGRLGRGKGYYDRYLAGLPQARRVGVAFARQLVEAVPEDPHDLPVHVVVTEAGVRSCPPRGAP